MAEATDHGAVIELISKEDFDKVLERSNIEGKAVIVDFTAVWCGPCRRIGPLIVELSKKYPNIIFVKVDVDHAAELCEIYKIGAMPTFILLKPGESQVADPKTQLVVGADTTKLQKMVELACAVASA
ncbi:hypothetical protein CBR_g26356 [Chara braunii]|uniref:Thioredoxin domain-containing protein n=1 Tax=Chara braunii TaxID=69332 RepID=A0A388L7S3_CHABU|nr:hypothetical protein CBR_g26356 [Chara braunii]|eukprot:GBG78328.1 hypothetical protein CBR_g26356 [Chara braunii]